MPAARPPIQALLIDLSGTLHVGSTPIPGAVEALSRLRQYNAHGDPTHADLGNPLIRTDPVCSADAQDVSLLARQKLPFRFCSNTSKEGRQELQQRLSGMGFEIRVEDDELWTSLGALSGLLRRKGLKNPFCFLQESAKQEVLSNLGCSGDTEASLNYDSVIVGLAPNMFTYEHLNTAFRILLPSSSSPAKPLIVTHRAKYVRTSTKDASGEHDTLSLGPGPFVAALETATGVHAEVVGKPSRAFFETVIASLDLEDIPESTKKGKIAIIGDDIETDLGGGAVELGLWRVLVKTGKYRPGDEHRPGVVPPDEVCDSFATFVDSLVNS